MPRVEIVPSDLRVEESTPTIDVCASCHGEFEEGGELPDRSSLQEAWPDATVGSTNVDHPPYDDMSFEYECEVCGKPLDLEEDS